MRIFEDCPYITPCGFCSRKLKPCEEKEKQRKQMAQTFLEKKFNVPPTIPEEMFFGKQEEKCK